MSQFNRCVDRSCHHGSYKIECKFGLWSVQAATKQEAEQEAKRYFEQYKLDGEYSAIIGGKNVTEVLMEEVNK